MPPWLNTHSASVLNAGTDKTIHLLERGLDFTMAEFDSESLISKSAKMDLCQLCYTIGTKCLGISALVPKFPVSEVFSSLASYLDTSLAATVHVC